MKKEITEALERLERASQENARVTKRLRKAAETLAEHIESLVPHDVELPRGYEVRTYRSNVGSAVFLLNRREEFVDGIGGYLHRDFSVWISATERHTLLEFARDVADGWLDELAEWLEKRAAETEEAAQQIEANIQGKPGIVFDFR